MTAYDDDDDALVKEPPLYESDEVPPFYFEGPILKENSHQSYTAEFREAVREYTNCLYDPPYKLTFNEIQEQINSVLPNGIDISSTTINKWLGRLPTRHWKNKGFNNPHILDIA